MDNKLTIEEIEMLEAFREAITLMFDNGRWDTINNRMYWCVSEEAMEEIDHLTERFTR